MELPGFKERSGTSMGRAMSRPAQLGPVRQLIPETRRLIALNDPEAEGRLAYAKANAITSVVGAVGDVVKTHEKIDYANQDMAQKAGSSEYKNRMAIFAVDAKKAGHEMNEDGEYGWETYESRLEEESDRLKEELREKYKFDRPTVEANWQMSTDGSYTAFSVDATEFVNKKKIDQAGAYYAQSMMKAANLAEAEGFTADAVALGVITPEQGINNMFKWQNKDIFDTFINTSHLKQSKELMDAMKDARAGTGTFKNLTIPQRNDIYNASLSQTKNLHLQEMEKYKHTGGLTAAAEYMKLVSDGGTDASHTLDEIDHNAVVSSLKGQFNTLVAIEKANDAGQTSTVMLEPVFSGDFDKEKLDSLANQKGTESYDDSMGLFDDKLRSMVSDDPDNFLMNTTSIAYRLAYIGDQSEVITNFVEQSMRGGDPRKMIDALTFMTSIESDKPAAFSDVKAVVRDRAEYFAYEVRTGMVDVDDPNAVSKINQRYIDYQNMGADEKDDRNQRANNHLRFVEAEEGGLQNKIRSLGVNVNDFPTEEGWASDFKITVGIDAEGDFRSAYKKAFRYTNDSAYAEEYAYNEWRRSYGYVKDGDGGLRADKRPPELLIPKGVLSEAEHRDFIEEQKGEMLDVFNARKKAESDYAGTVELEDVRLVYNGRNADGMDKWTVTDLGGIAHRVTSEDGMREGPLEFSFDPYAKSKAPYFVENQRNGKAKRYMENQQYVASKHSIALIDNQIETIDPGGSDTDVKSTVKEYNFEWKQLNDEQRTAATNSYMAMFNMLKDANTKENVNNDAQIHWYLFTQRYMQKDTEGNGWKKPPGMK